MRFTWPIALVSLAFSTGPLWGQDRLGGAVAVLDGKVALVKAGPGRGPAAVYLYAHGTEGWELVERLIGAGSARHGHAVSASAAVRPGMITVGAGDPEGSVGAHVFTLDEATGSWIAEDLPLVETTAEGDRDADGQPITLQTVLRILQPAPRTVAVHEGVAAVGARVPHMPGTGAVWVFERRGTGWSATATLERATPGRNDGFGTAVAVDRGVLAVGAPTDESGAVVVFTRDDGGRWSESSALRPVDLGSGMRFGAALALDGDVLVVGAPGAGEGWVVVYRRDETGAWDEEARLHGETEGERFGTSIALFDGELLVGAPRADGRRGRVDWFVRNEARGWESRGSLGPPAEVQSGMLGAAVAMTDDIAVAGAPGSDGGLGGAAVYRRRASGAWGTPEWIALGGALQSVTGSEIRCADGTAAGFSCDKVDLEAFLTIEALGGRIGEGVSDLWGWTDPETGREYALVGRTGGLVFVDVSDPVAPVVLGTMFANPSGARDIKVYADHAFLTGDGAGQHGLLVFDLTRLRDVAGPPVSFEPDARYDGIASAHNLVIDPEAGFAYPVGASGGGNTCGGGLHMVDIRNPTEPVFAGCYTDTEGLVWQGRTHDAQCVTYRGPDEAHRGKQICLASNETALRVVDVTDKENPIPLSAARYPGVAYVHQGWLTEDQQYFYLDDELDELVGTTDRTRTLIWDIRDLDDPVVVGEFLGATGATDHNLLIMGNRMYQANYHAGLRVVDISDPERPVEVAYFDTTPYEGNPAGFAGAWTAYPFFESGTVLVSSMGEGLFVLKPRPPDLTP